MQLDLFADNRDVMLRNDVIAALRGRDGDAGTKARSILAAENPSDSLLAPLETLLSRLADPPKRFAGHDEAADAVCAMDSVVVPAANVVFGPNEAREWLAPMWRSLANAAAWLSYSVDRPDTHAAHMLLRAGDWAAAESRVVNIPSWRRIPVPLAWMAEARFGQGGLQDAWCSLAELAWIRPAGFAALARRLEAPALRKLLDEFEVAFESDEEPQLAWFPAWTLIAEPSLATTLRETQVCNDAAPERAARLVIRLLALERQGRHADIVAARKQLRDTHARLFACYMATR